MTIECTQTSVVYRGGGETRSFPIPFPVLDKSHIRVEMVDNQERQATVCEGTDYEILIARDEDLENHIVGVELTNSLPHGWTLRIARRMPLTQECVFLNQGPNSPWVTEECLDKLTMLAQQLDTDLNETGTGLAVARDKVAAMDAALATVDKTLGRLETEKAGRQQLNEAETRLALADQRLRDEKAPLAHAGRHHVGGADPVTPQSIGAVDRAHLYEANPHPQYILADDHRCDAYFVYDASSGLLRLAEKVFSEGTSLYFSLSQTGMVCMKGSFHG